MSNYYVPIKAKTNTGTLTYDLVLEGLTDSDKSNKPNTSINDAGNWECKTSGNWTDPNGGSITTTCYFKIKKAYLKDGHAVYEFRDNYISGGNGGRFYIYRTYLLDKYKWNIKSKDGVTLSTLMVNVSKDKKENIQFKVNTNSKNNYCYFNVEPIYINVPSGVDDPGGLGNWNSILVYRSIDESNPFPKISNYLNYPENWKKYYINAGYTLKRVNDSFIQDIDYRTKVLNRDLIKKLNKIETNYTFDDVTSGGNVTSVVNDMFFEAGYGETKHSNKGQYDVGSDSQ